MTRPRILVLGCYTRNALAVINALDLRYDMAGAASKKKFVISPDGWLRSKRLQKVFRYTDPALSAEAFVVDLIRIGLEYRASAIYPTGTLITDIVSEQKNRIERESGARVLVDEYSRLGRLTDKWEIIQICEASGVSHPKTWLVGSNEKLDELRLPLVAKPKCHSSGSEGVSFLETTESLKSFLARHHSGYVLQERISGQLHDVAGCAFEGKCHSLFTQRRLRSFNDFGGGGILNQSTREPVLMEAAEKIMNETKYTGVFMMDFIRDDSGQFYLLECNPKIWGTTQLCVDAGMNIPQHVVELMFEQKPPQRLREYREGIVYRWIFPDMIASWFSKPLSVSRFLRRVAASLRSYPGTKGSRTNLQIRNLKHLLGIVLNKLGKVSRSTF